MVSVSKVEEVVFESLTVRLLLSLESQEGLFGLVTRFFPSQSELET